MTRKNRMKASLIACLFLLALGGWLLHLRIHLLSKDAENYIPYISGIISVFALPLLFCFRRTITLAYIINGFLAIIGSITMAHFTNTHTQGAITLYTLVFNSTLADIAILWAKFLAGKMLYDLQFLKSEADPAPKGRFFRYPNMGWWWVHLAALTTVYILGHAFWR